MTIKLAPEMEQALRRRSAAMGKPASALIREALHAYLSTAAPASPSAYDLGADLFGKHRGPAQLASNHKTMAASNRI
ncbi:MAG TPA: CopG family transcriptional regulator [Variovorax sp.]|nr:CopG family transcriptional regulator [Variovorax sp.]